MASNEANFIMSKDSDLYNQDKLRITDKIESIMLSILKDKDYNRFYSDEYATYNDCLRQLNPKSKLLNITCIDKDIVTEYDDVTDDLLKSSPYSYIPIIRNKCDLDYIEFKSNIRCEPYIAVGSVVGLDIRVVYYEGNLISARLKGTTGLGLDITNQMLIILGDSNEGLGDYGLTELRGKLFLTVNKTGICIQKEIINILEGYKYDSDLMKLNFLVYDMICEDYDKSTVNKYEDLFTYGFLTPIYHEFVLEKVDSLDKEVDSACIELEILSTEVGYPLDGFIIKDSKCETLCKVELGKWKKSFNEVGINYISWVTNKETSLPVIIFNETLNLEGVEYNELVLKSPASLLILSAYENSTLYFRYTRELGIIPITHDYRLLLEHVKTD